jgi:hypothetical protein
MAIVRLPDSPIYIDFDIRIRRASENNFIAQFKSPAGEAQSEFKLPISRRDVSRVLDWVSQAASQSATRNVEDDSLDSIKRIGKLLFMALFEGLPERFYRRHKMIDQSEGGLLLRLHIEDADPELVTMPWEFLYDGEDFVDLSTRSSLVRMPVAQMPGRIEEPISPPLCMLMVSTNLPGEFQLPEPFTDLADRLSGFDLRIISDASFDRLARAIEEEQPHILHLNLQSNVYDPSSVPDQVSFRAADGTPDWVSFDSLIDLLRGESTRLVCLGAPFSHLLAAKLSPYLPAVIGLQGSLTDLAFTVFYESLYQEISYGRPLTAAVSRGRLAIDRQRPGSREWGLPVLYAAEYNAILLNKPQFESSSYSSSVISRTPPSVREHQRELNKLQVQLDILQRNKEALEKLNPNDDEIKKVTEEIAQIEARIDQVAQSE